MTDATRKLATIVALDVAGYSARTEADEAKTTGEIAALRSAIEAIAARHAGRIFNTAGDGFMLEFASSLAAVEAAQELAEKCLPPVRVGVHVGDVIVQPNGDLLGHGVNVAARLMAQAQPGAALVSADVRRMIRGPIAERLISRGSLRLDKMAETIEAFALIGAVAGEPVPAQAKSAEPLLAVLPFDNLSNDSEMQFFSDGVSEEILYALSRASGLGVIGRTSAFQFRGPDKKNAAHSLKATHILDGTVRKSGANMRVSAQLIEVASGRGIWTERFDRSISEAFQLQDDIAARVAGALRSVLPIRAQSVQIDPVAYEMFLHARRFIREAEDDAVRRAESLLLQIVSREPRFAEAWAFLGTARALLLPKDHDATREPLHDGALAATMRALELDPSSASAYATLCNLKPAFSSHGEKVHLMEKAYALLSNDTRVLTGYGGALGTVGRMKEALPLLAQAARLEPMASFGVAIHAVILCTVGRVEESIAVIEDARRRMPDASWIWTIRWVILFSVGRFDEAAGMCASGATLPSGMSENDAKKFRFCHSLLQAPQTQREQILRTILGPESEATLPLDLCLIASQVGCADLAFEILFQALASGRRIGPTTGSGGTTRSFLPSLFFRLQSVELRKDRRFPLLCQRVGLVAYWRESGHWPDCADEVPYDFKAECEKATHGAS